MRFWIDIEDSSGTLQGEGPIATAQYFEVTSRISKAGSVKTSMPGSDIRSALVVKKRIMRGKTLINQAVSELGAGSIDHIERSQKADGEISLDISGDDLLRELVNRHVGSLLIDDGAGGPDDDGPTVIMALAPSGWSLDTDEGFANSYKSVFHQYDGETVLEALTNLSQLTGEQFRLGSGRKVIWIRKLGSAKITHSGYTGAFIIGETVTGQTSGATGTLREVTGGVATPGYLYIENVSGSYLDAETIQGQSSLTTVTVDKAYNPSSGLFARQGISPLDMEGNTDHCIITSAKEIEDSYESQIGRVYAIGSGTGDAKLTLQGATITPPTGYLLGNDAKGYYLQHTATWTTYGIERRKSFKDAQNVNELYEQAYEYLSRAKDTHKAYSIEVTKLDAAISVGKTIRVTMQRWLKDTNTDELFLAFNITAVDLYILEATNKIDSNGARSARLVVATVDEMPSPMNDASALRSVAQQGQQVANHRQPVDAASLGLHKTSHQNGGTDEINVAGLSGELADNQPPKAHKTSHEKSGSDALSGTISITDIEVSGRIKLATNVIRGVFQKTVTDNVATSVFRITTTNETGDTDGGGYSVFVHALIGHSVSSASTKVATKGFTAQFCRSVNYLGAGVNSVVSEVVETASAATDSGGRDIGTVTMSVLETSEYLNDIQFTVDLTGVDIGTGNVLVMVELVWWGFTTAPALSQL